MYGTVARMRIKAGSEQQLLEMNRAVGAPKGIVAEYLYRMDSDPTEYYLVVVFESKEAYDANAARPEQHAFYLQYRALLEAEPEWHDGTIIDAQTWGGATA
jgi:quinol monooxygenase YgiN